MTSSSFHCKSSAATSWVLYGHWKTFSVAGPTTWHSLRRHLQDPIHTTANFGHFTKSAFFYRVLMHAAYRWASLTITNYYINWRFVHLTAYLLTYTTYLYMPSVFTALLPQIQSITTIVSSTNYFTIQHSVLQQREQTLIFHYLQWTQQHQWTYISESTYLPFTLTTSCYLSILPMLI